VGRGLEKGKRLGSVGEELTARQIKNDTREDYGKKEHGGGREDVSWFQSQGALARRREKERVGGGGGGGGGGGCWGGGGGGEVKQFA